MARVTRRPRVAFVSPILADHGVAHAQVEACGGCELLVGDEKGEKRPEQRRAVIEVRVTREMARGRGAIARDCEPWRERALGSSPGLTLEFAPFDRAY